MGIFDFLFGSKDKIKRKDAFSPEQQQLFKSYLSQTMGLGEQGGGASQGLDILQQFLDPQSDVFKDFEAPYRREFEEETIPQIAERFAGMGGGRGAAGGALSSSGFGQALSSAGSGLQTNLAALKSGLRQSAIEKLLSQYQQGTQMGLGASPYNYEQRQGSQGLLGPLLSGIGSGFAGPFGSALGKSMGQRLSQTQDNKFPLTNTYDSMFRMTGLPIY